MKATTPLNCSKMELRQRWNIQKKKKDFMNSPVNKVNLMNFDNMTCES